MRDLCVFFHGGVASKSTDSVPKDIGYFCPTWGFPARVPLTVGRYLSPEMNRCRQSLRIMLQWEPGPQRPLCERPEGHGSRVRPLRGFLLAAPQPGLLALAYIGRSKGLETGVCCIRPRARGGLRGH